jgi:polyisoprenoid-binding protein YceI
VKAALSGLLIALLGGPVLAAPITVDYAKSSLVLSGLANGKARQMVMCKFEAKIDFDPAALDAGTVHVSVDLGSASVMPVGAKDIGCDPAMSSRDTSLAKPTLFGDLTVPAVFDGKGFTRGKDDKYAIAGMFTMLGSSIPLELDFDLKKDGHIYTATGLSSLSRHNVHSGDSPPFPSATDDATVAAKVDIGFIITASDQ